MKKNDHIVAFIDILGFTGMVENHFSGKDKLALKSLTESIKNAKKYAVDHSKKYYQNFKIKISFKQFSDCVSISMPISPIGTFTPLMLCGVFISIVRLYQFSLLCNKILTRGGVSIAGHFENSNIIFSKALINAYKLESQSAIYPRVLLDKSILKFIENELSKTPGEFDMFYNIYGKSIISDWDNEVFISQVDIFLGKDFINTSFSENDLKHHLDIFKRTNNTDADLNDIFDVGPYSYLIDELLDDIKEYLNENPNEKKSILVKYYWLQEFISWSLDPTTSRIHFKKYFEKPS